VAALAVDRDKQQMVYEEIEREKQRQRLWAEEEYNGREGTAGVVASVSRKEGPVEVDPRSPRTPGSFATVTERGNEEGARRKSGDFRIAAESRGADGNGDDGYGDAQPADRDDELSSDDDDDDGDDDDEDDDHEEPPKSPPPPPPGDDGALLASAEDEPARSGADDRHIYNNNLTGASSVVPSVEVTVHLVGGANEGSTPSALGLARYRRKEPSSQEDIGPTYACSLYRLL
jgi:hypothetical protein